MFERSQRETFDFTADDAAGGRSAWSRSETRRSRGREIVGGWNKRAKNKGKVERRSEIERKTGGRGKEREREREGDAAFRLKFCHGVRRSHECYFPRRSYFCHTRKLGIVFQDTSKWWPGSPLLRLSRCILERSRTTGHRLRTRRDSGSWYAAARPRLRRLLVRVANDWRHRTLLLYRYTHYTGGTRVVDSCVPFFVLRSFIIRLSCTRTGEGHRCARGSGCIPASMFAKCKWPTRSGKRKKRKERKRRRRRGGGKKRGAPQRGRLIGGGHCPRIWPWLGFQAAFHFCSNRVSGRARVDETVWGPLHVENWGNG